LSVAAPARVGACGPDVRAAGARLGVLFETHGRMVYAICRALLRDVHEADDATQASFLAAYEALLGGTTVRDPAAWIATIASSVTPEDDVERRATTARLRRAIEELPEKQRDAVVLRDLYGLRYGEICLALGISRPSLEALLFRAHRTLRVRLKPATGTAVVVPLAVREGIAQAVPWFGTAPAVSVASAAGGAGILGKLGAPAAVKVAAAAAGLVGAGTAAVEIERRPPTVPAAPTSTVPSRVSSRPAGAAPVMSVVSRAPVGDGQASREPKPEPQPAPRASGRTTPAPRPAPRMGTAISEPAGTPVTVAQQSPPPRAPETRDPVTATRRADSATAAARTGTTESRPVTTTTPRARVVSAPTSPRQETTVPVATGPEPEPAPAETTPQPPTRTTTTPSR
jgi:DNA-directed RNA polymerase specialized sigma24 family protein